MRLWLAAYFAVYMGVCFFWRTFVVWRRTGVNPLVLGSSDSVYDYLGRASKLTVLLARR